MKKEINARQWTMETPQKDDGSFLINLDKSARGSWVDVEVRCVAGAVVNGITEDGETLFLASGQCCGFAGRLVGFAAIELVCSETFAYRANARAGRFVERLDPRPLAISERVSKDEPVQNEVRAALREYLAKLHHMRELRDPAAAEELLRDFLHGDVDFEDEPDEFGRGHTEMEEEFPEDRPPQDAPRRPAGEPKRSQRPEPSPEGSERSGEAPEGLDGEDDDGTPPEPPPARRRARTTPT